eukprot:INCI15592.2.p1 GENE.INCI15592.2~~INCI15592.2.p1  ORF type:complete len:230 (-),score=59.47 INCI15592.2:121-810(-)
MSFAWLGKKARVEDEPQDDAGSGEASTATSSSSSAAAFVQQQRQQGTKRSGSDDTEPAREFSVHITHVPFTATQADLDEFFKGHDCVVDDIRMVRKHNKEGERVFTGVAFVDFFDEQSMRKALSLHQSKLWPGSLKINIRRTLDKGRLAAVAASRTNQVQSKKTGASRTEKSKTACSRSGSGGSACAAAASAEPCWRWSCEEKEEEETWKERTASTKTAKTGKGHEGTE